MKRRQLLQLSALGAIPASLGLVQSAFAQASGPIQFGCPVPMSGAFAANGKFADLGMKLAIDQYGTALKRQLAYTLLDTEGKPATAVRKVQESSQQQGARFFAGGILSSEALAMGPGGPSGLLAVFPNPGDAASAGRGRGRSNGPEG